MGRYDRGHFGPCCCFRHCAGIVLDYCRRRLPSLAPDDKVRILEIGSGSGGTSAVVMDALTAAAASAADDSAGSSTACGNGSVSGTADGSRGGSQSTSLQGLLERLEFVYTDISPQLVAYGRKTYGPHHPYAKFRVLDVERDVEAQVLRAASTWPGASHPCHVQTFMNMASTSG